MSDTDGAKAPTAGAPDEAQMKAFAADPRVQKWVDDFLGDIEQTRKETFDAAMGGVRASAAFIQDEYPEAAAKLLKRAEEIEAKKPWAWR